MYDSGGYLYRADKGFTFCKPLVCFLYWGGPAARQYAYKLDSSLVISSWSLGNQALNSSIIRGIWE